MTSSSAWADDTSWTVQEPGYWVRCILQHEPFGASPGVLASAMIAHASKRSACVTVAFGSNQEKAAAEEKASPPAAQPDPEAIGQGL